MYSNDEVFDILNEKGEKTGEKMTRGKVHELGALHGSVHIWVLRERIGGTEVLLQKRAEDKDSYPSCYDAAATGHIDSGEDSLSAAVRETSEELGYPAKPAQLVPLFRKRVSEDNIFHGKRFINNEITWVYLFIGEPDPDKLHYEEAEISELRWFDSAELLKALRGGDPRFCTDADELEKVLKLAEDRRK